MRRRRRRKKRKRKRKRRRRRNRNRNRRLGVQLSDTCNSYSTPAGTLIKSACARRPFGLASQAYCALLPRPNQAK
eukprot:8645700-Pyramimonas_sp.AAC.1